MAGGTWQEQVNPGFFIRLAGAASIISKFDPTKHVSCIAGLVFYQRESLPGYSAIFRHPNDELGFCYYLIPQGKDGMCGKVKVCS